MKIYLDFDGTVVEHQYPKIGRENFGPLYEILRTLTITNKNMEIQFATKETSMVTTFKQVTHEEFVNILQKYKPREIYNPQWSTNKVFIVITEYIESHKVMVYCNGEASKTPAIKTYYELFDFLKYQGLSDCFFTVDEDKI